MTKSIGIPTEIEALVLGAFLNSSENAKIGLKLVHEEDFVEKKHKIILKAIQDVFSEKSAVDIALIHNKLASEENLKETKGGAPYLIELTQGAGTSCHVEAYCDDLKKLTLKRQLISLSNSLSSDLQQGADESKIINSLKNKIGNIEKNKLHAESAFRHLLENNSEQQIVEDLKKTSQGVFTGFQIGQEAVKIPGGAMSIVAMPTSHGKTATLINFSLGVLKHHQDKSVYFFTYEESGASIQTLFINTFINEELSKNNREFIKNFLVNGPEKEKSLEKSNTLFLNGKNAFFEQLVNTGRLRVFYPNMAVEELIKAIHFIKKNTNVGLVCIDYMQLLKLLKWSQGSRQEELKQVCLLLKDCAIETGLPILLGAQFSRQVTMEADLSLIHIREAADVEHTANLVIGGWNRNFVGFTKDGNKDKSGNKITKESAIYFEIMKGRGIGNGHDSIIDFNGNTGKFSNKNYNEKIKVQQQTKPPTNF